MRDGVHCHRRAILGWDADRALLEAAGVNVERLESGCCGLAGSFGIAAGHSGCEACAEQALLPRRPRGQHETVVLADRFSCRTQLDQLDSGGRAGVHLAELLAAGYHQDQIDGTTVRPDRPRRPGRLARGAATAAAAALVGVAAGMGARRLGRLTHR